MQASFSIFSVWRPFYNNSLVWLLVIKSLFNSYGLWPFVILWIKHLQMLSIIEHQHWTQTEDWRLFDVSLRRSLKAVFYHNWRMYTSVCWIFSSFKRMLWKLSYADHGKLLDSMVNFHVTQSTEWIHQICIFSVWMG